MKPPAGFERYKPWYAILDLTGNPFLPTGLFSGGEVGWLHDMQIDTLFSDAGTTEAVIDDSVYQHNDKSGNGYNSVQATLTARAILREDGSGNRYLEFDVVDDKYNKTAPTITGGTVAIFTSVGAWFDDIDVSAGSFDWGPGTYTGGPAGLFDALKQGAGDYREIARLVIDRALTAAEKASLLSYYKQRGCPGEITLGNELVSNTGDPFVSTTDWASFGSTLSVISNNLNIDTPGTNGAYAEVTATTGDYVYLDYETVENSGSWRVTTRENSLGGTTTNTQIIDTGRKGLIFQKTTNDTVLYYQNTVSSAGNLDLVRVNAKVMVFP